ncbi:MAG: hypothetical protein ACFFCQ_05095 [Promethearchaeota archaeon]
MTLTRDHEGIPTIKLLLWGPAGVGKTDYFTIMQVLKLLENPETVKSITKIKSTKGDTLFFDRAVLGLGEKCKLHLVTTPGEDRHAGQRKIISEGSNACIAVLDASKAQWKENQDSLEELNRILGPKIANKEIPSWVLVNKREGLPNDTQMDVNDTKKLLEVSGMDSLSPRISTVNIAVAKSELIDIIKKSPKKAREPKTRPKSVNALVTPLKTVLKEVLTA